MRRALAVLVFASCVFVFLVPLLFPAASQATTYTWANVGADWGTAANWGGTLPVGSDVGQFTSPTSYGFQPNVGEPNTIGGIWQTGNAPVNVTGASTLTINGATINGNANTGIEMDPGAGAVSVSAPIALGGPQQWLNNSSSALTVTGPVYTAGNTLTLGGGGQTNIAGGLGVNSGPGGLVVGPGANVSLSTGAGATPNSYTGPTTINGGMLTLQAPAAPAISTDAQLQTYLTQQGLLNNVLVWLDPSNPANYITTGGSVTTLINLSPSNSASVGNATTISGSNQFDAPTLTPNNPAFNGKTTVYFGAQNVLGIPNLSAMNNTPYTIFAIQAKSSNAGGNANHFLGTSGNPASNGNTALQLGYKNDTTYLAGQFGNDLAAPAAAFTGAEVPNEYTVELSMSSGRTLYSTGAPVAGGYLLNYTGLSTLGQSVTGYANPVNIGVVGASYYTNATDSAFNGYFQGDVGEILMFNAPLTAAQRQVVDSYLQYKWYNPAALPQATPVTLTGGGTLNLNGVNTTIGSLGSTDPTTQVQLGTATLTTGGLNTSTVFAGSITGSGGLNKVGVGAMVLSGTNTYAGPTNVGAGTLQIVNPSALSAGSLVYLGSATLSYLNDGAGNGGTIGVGNNITLFWNTNNATVNVGPLSTSNTGNTVAFGALSIGSTANTLNGTVIFTAANGYRQSYTALNLPGLTGNGFTLDPTSTTLQIGNVTNQELGVIAGHSDTVFLGGTSIGNTITGSITDVLGGSSSGGFTPVTMNGSGQWIISGTNLPYHGNTSVSSGSLAFQSNYLPVNSPVLIGAGTLQLLNNGIGAVGGTAGIGGNVGNNTTINTAFSAGSGTLVINGGITTDNIYVGSVGGTNSGNTIAVSILANGTAAQSSTINFLGGNGYSLSIGTLGLSAVGGDNTTLNPTSTTLSIQNVVNNESGSTSGHFDTFTLGGVTTGNMIQGAISDSYSFTSVGNGDTHLTVSGGGWTLAGSNSFHGPINISAGTLTIGGAGVLGGGTLTITSGTAANYFVSTGNYGNFTGSTFTNSGLFVMDTSSNQTFSGAISGGGAFQQNGSGVTTLAAANTYTGGTTIGGGTLQTSGFGSIASSSGIVNNAVLAFGQTNSVTYPNPVSGSGAIYQIGSGSTALSSAANFTGPITVAGGSLYINGPNGTSAISVAGGATLGGNSSAGATATIASSGIVAGGYGGLGTLTLGGLNFTGNGAINVGSVNNYYASTGTAATVNVSGNNGLVASGAAGAVVINLSGLGPVVPGANYHLLSYNGSIQGTGFSGFSLNTSGLSLPNNGSYTLANHAGYADLNLSLSNYPIWTGSQSTSWDTSTQNWNSSATALPTNFNTNDFAYFGDSGVANTTITMTSSVTPYAAYFANNTLSYTLSGSSGIGGAAALVLNGAGSLTINNANSYTGGTYLYNGLLNVGNASALGAAASTLTLGVPSGSGTLDNTSGGPLTLPNYPMVWSGGFTYLGSSNPLNLGTGGVTLAANSTLNVAGSTLTVGGVISGNYGITQTGAGTLLLNGANTFTGNTLVSGGTLLLGNASALQDSALGTSGAGTVSFGTLTSATVGGLANGGALALTNGTGGAVTLSVGNNGLNNASSAAISGSGGITMIGSGLQALSGNNSYTGGTNISAGTLQFQGAAGSTGLPSGGTIGIGANATLSIANDGTGSGGTIGLGAANSSITLTAAGVTTTIDARPNLTSNTNNTVSFGTLSNGTSVNALSSTINFTGANGYTQSYAGLGLSGAAGASTTLAPLSTTVVINGNVVNQESTFTANHYDNLTLAGSTAGNTINGAIFDSSGYTAVGFYDTRLVKTGPSQWILAGANPYHGPTVVNGGTLALGPNGSINNSTTINITSGATLDVSQVSGGFALVNSQTLSGAGNYYVNGAMTLNSGATVTPGSVAVNNGFTLVPTGLYPSSAGTLNVGSLTLQPGSALGFELASGAIPQLINVANTLTINGGGVFLADTSGTNQFLTPGTYPLINYGTLSGSVANLSVLNSFAAAYSFSTSGNVLDVNVLASNGWTGGSGGPYNWSTGANWSSGNPPTSGSAAVFAGTQGLANTNNIVGLNLAGMAFASGAGAFTLSGNSLQLSGPIVNNSAVTQTVGLPIQLAGNQTITAASGNIVLAGALSDGGSNYGITTGGAYTVALSAANTFTGPTTAAGGQLRLSNSLALQYSTVTVSGGNLAFDSSVSPAAFTLGGLSGGNNISLANLAGSPVDLSVGNNNAGTNFSGVLSGPGSLDKTGGGTLILSGANTFIGNTVISGGILQLANASALQNSTLDNSGGGLIDWGSTLTAFTIGGLTNGGSLYLQNDSGAAVTLSVGNNNQNNASSATISGSGAINKIGAGVQALSGNNTYTGGTIITGGTLQFQGGSTLTPTSIPSSGTISLSGGTGSVGVLSVAVDGTGSGVTINGPAFITPAAASGDAATIDVRNNGSGNTGNTVSFGTLQNGPVNSGWTSTFYFTGANGYLQSYASLGLSASSGDNTDLYPISTTVAINNVVNRENTSFSGHFDTLTLDGDTTGNTIYGVIADSTGWSGNSNGDTRITKQNSSQWILAAANTNHGPTSIAGGTLQLGTGQPGQDGALYTAGLYLGSPASAVTFANSAVLAYDLSPSAGTLGSVPYAITGAGAVAVLSGSVTFSAADTYTLPTTIGGTLALAGTGSINNTPKITLSNGAALDVSAVSPWTLHSGQTLTGTGAYFVNGSMTNAAGSTILPGSLAAISSGTLNVGGLTLGGGGLSYEMGANGLGNVGQDLINVTGSNGLTIGSATTINFYDSSGTNQFGTPGAWPIMAYSGTLGGALANLSVGNPNLNAAYSFSTSGGYVDLDILPVLGWTGSAGSPFLWSVGGNWATGVAITSGSPANFQGTTGLSNSNNIAGLSLPGIIFASNAGAFNLSGNSIQISGAITSSSTATQTIGLAMQLVGNPNVNASAGNIVLNGVLSDAGSGFGLNVNGPKAVVLGAANTYSGNTNVNSGTLSLANAQAVQNSTVSVGSSGALTFASGITSPNVGGLAGGGNIALATTAAQAVALNVGGNGQSTTYSGALSGAGGLIKVGAGTLTLAGPVSYSYSGATLISGGVLQVAQLRGSIGIQFLGGSNPIVGSDGPGPMSNWNSLPGANPSGANLINSSGGTTTAAIVVSGAGGTVHDTDPDQLLSGYIYVGANTITVNLTGIPYSSYNLYAISEDETAGHENQLTMGGKTFYFTASVPANDNGAFTQITNTSPSSYPIGNYAVVNGLSGASQTVTNYSSVDTGFSGIEIVNAGQMVSPYSPVVISNGSTFDMTNSVQTVPSLSSTDGLGSQVLLGGGQLVITGPGTTTFDGVISDAGLGGSLAVQGGQLTLTGQNTFSGPTIVSGGVLQLNSGGGPALTGNIQVSGGTAVWLQNNQVNSSANAAVSAGLMNIGQYSNTFNNVQITGGTIAGSSGTLTSSTNVDAQNGTINAILGGSAGLNKTTAGTVVLGAANTYSGNTNVTAGNLTLANQLALQNSTVNANGGSLAFVAGSTAPVVGALSGTGNISLATAASEPVALNAGGNGQSTTYLGVMSGAGGLTKQGAGTLTLAGTQAYSGATVVSGGVLQLGPFIPTVTVAGFGANTTGTGVSSSITNGTWTFNTNGGAYTTTPVTGGTLTLTDNVGSEARSAFYQTTLPLTGEMFNANFVYQASGGTSLADGACFILQNDSRGDTALGGAGGALGYGTANTGTPISPSAALELNIYASNTVGYSFGTNGAITAKTAAGAVNLASKDPIQINLSYDGSNDLTVSMLDLVTSASYSNTVAVGNLATLVGGTTAYVGFSGGDGSVTSTQAISNFSYSYLGMPYTVNNVLPTTTALSVAAGATADLYGSSQTVGSLAGAGTVTTSVNAACTLTVAGSMQTFSGLLQDGAGTLGLTVTSPGGVTLTAANAYSGPTNINGGTLQLGNGQSGNDGSITGAGGVNDNGLLVYNLFGAQTPAYAIGGSGAVTKTGPGTVTLANGANSYGGGTNVLQGLMVIAPGSGAVPFGPLNVSGGSLDQQGNTSVISTLGGNGVIGNGSSGTANLATLFVVSGGTFSGTIRDGGFGGNAPTQLQVVGGVLALTGTNTYSGGTYVDGGTLIAANNEAIADGSGLYIGDNVGAFGAVVPAGASTASAPAGGAPGYSPGGSAATSVPEPGTLAMLAAAAIAAAALRKRSGSVQSSAGSDRSARSV